MMVILPKSYGAQIKRLLVPRRFSLVYPQAEVTGQADFAEGGLPPTPTLTQ